MFGITDYFFSDIEEGERFFLNEKDVSSHDLYVCKVLDEDYCMFNDRTFKFMILLDSEMKKVWQLESISYYPTYCSMTDKIAFRRKNEAGEYIIETINKSDGSMSWTLSLASYTTVSIINCIDGLIYIGLNEESSYCLYAFNMKDGMFVDKWILQGEGFPSYISDLSYDKHLSRFVSPFIELDFNSKTCFPRSEFKDNPHLNSIVGIQRTGVWNARYYVDCYNNENWNAEKKDAKAYPYEIIIFDRLSDSVVSRTVVDEDNFLSAIAEFRIQGDRLYARDNFRNLRVYDFSEYSSGQSST